MNDGPVSNGYIVSDDGRKATCNMNNAIILDIAILTDTNTSHIAADNRVMPHTCTRPYNDFTNNLSPGGNKTVGCNLGGAFFNCPNIHE